MTERRRGRAGLAGALEERIPPVPELSGDSAKGAGGSWVVGVADLGDAERTSLTDTWPQIEGPFGGALGAPATVAPLWRSRRSTQLQLLRLLFSR